MIIYITYHLLREPETDIDQLVFIPQLLSPQPFTVTAPLGSKNFQDANPAIELNTWQGSLWRKLCQDCCNIPTENPGNLFFCCMSVNSLGRTYWYVFFSDWEVAKNLQQRALQAITSCHHHIFTTLLLPCRWRPEKCRWRNGSCNGRRTWRKCA